MACRTITQLKRGLISKSVPNNDSLKEMFFPRINKSENLLKLIEEKQLSNNIKQAIIQQYNEILLYNIVDFDYKFLLAPQVAITYEENNLPIIIYPRFNPLIPESKVWNHTENELQRMVGFYANKKGISEKKLMTFYIEIEKLCHYYDLNEDDILLNPSNIGYHPVLGLRIIDYGLAENNKLFNY